MTDYITIDDLSDYLISGPTTFAGGLNNQMMQRAVTAASRRVEQICNRRFTLDDAPSDKFFSPQSVWECDFVDRDYQRWDLSTATGLAVHVDSGYNGTYPFTLTVNVDFELAPKNGYRFGQPWPFEGLRALASTSAGFPPIFPPPHLGYRDTVKVTGTWGWPAVPDGVVQATLMLAAQLYKNKDNVGGFIGFETGAVRVREDPMALTYLADFMPVSRYIA